MRGFVVFCIFVFTLITLPVNSLEEPQIKGPKGVDYGQQGRSIGPITPSDTLWRIAQKVRPDESVTIYQVMSALYRKNPQAFLDQNLNHMRDGAYLKIPTMGEIRKEDPNLARQRSDQDDALWELKKSGMLDNQTIEQAQKKVTQARKIDVEEAQDALTKQLKSIQLEQDSRLMDLQSQFRSSVRNVEEILQENDKLKKQLGNISEELQNVREQLGKDSEIQQQLQSMINLQTALIERQEEQRKKTQSGFDLSSALSNPLALILLATLPALLAIGAGIFFLRKRKQDQDSGSDDDDFMPQTAASAATDPLDLGMPTAVPETEIEDSVQLDDDILPEDDDIMFDSLEDDTFDEGSSELDQDELDSLLNEDIVFDDDTNETDIPEDLDDFLQQSFDGQNDDAGDDVSLDLEGDDFGSESIDDLLDEGAEFNEEELDVDVSDDALAALSEELADDQEDIDIDALVESAGEDSSDDDFDIDDLLMRLPSPRQSQTVMM
ncbi:FimV/HubP family polar landmark protein [Pseudoalteromonas sp. T1lg23B]|uniref:FimV/HubP family polar landmark protein n=1 Tax=Pseudoalteromonas sp. T1lg23B TaxID=2077097 RepID=UPI001F22D966|nr:FimV/HubP family polar landmark protein [Pseudoalteromonas sp. T1lg23B]